MIIAIWIWTIIAGIGVVFVGEALVDAWNDAKAIRLAGRNSALEIMALSHVRGNFLSLLGMLIFLGLGIRALLEISIGSANIYLLIVSLFLLVINRVFDRIDRKIIMDREGVDRSKR